MAQYEIPLIAAAQTFSISLSGVTYTMTLQWRDVDMGGWVLDISDSLGNPLLMGIPLITGVDLLEDYAYMDFGGSLRVFSDDVPDNVPTYDNLGIDSHLYFITS